MNTTWWAGRMAKDTYSHEHPVAPPLNVGLPAPFAAVEEDAPSGPCSPPYETTSEKPFTEPPET